MIKYALMCGEDHEFDAWFSDSQSYDEQAGRGLVECPHCGSTDVRKALMAPAVSTSRRQAATSPEEAFKAVASKVKAHIRSNFDYVGGDFASEARAIHDGKKPQRLIYGEASADESQALSDAGVPVTPLPDAFAPTPPKKAN